jgi:flagella basal body P-ring formation protein FlgA
MSKKNTIPLHKMIQKTASYALVALCLATPASAATLRMQALLDTDNLTVGDVFEDISAEKANHILGPAPLPGKDMVLDTNTLMRISSAMGLSWRPAHAQQNLVVRRNATIIERDAIESRIREELIAKGLNGTFDISFTTGTPVMTLKSNSDPVFEVSSLDYDRHKNTFRTVLMAPSVQNPQTSITVAGQIRQKIAVPVLKSTVKNGETISRHDVDYIELYEREIQPDTVLDAHSLIGMTPRRFVAAGKPIQMINLESPKLVSRGDNVTLIFSGSTLLLTAKGKAMSHGGKGDMVRVVNIASNRPLEGIITGPGQVTVTP